MTPPRQLHLNTVSLHVLDYWREEKRGITYKELAGRLGVSEKMLKAWTEKHRADWRELITETIEERGFLGINSVAVLFPSRTWLWDVLQDYHHALSDVLIEKAELKKEITRLRKKYNHPVS